MSMHAHNRAGKIVNIINMFPAPLFLALLILTAPAVLVIDAPVSHGVVMAAAAVSVAIVALRIRPGEAAFLSSVIRPVAIIASIPAFAMLVQVLPWMPVGLANPIWESASVALGHPLAGSISIDPGDTLISLARYLSTAAIAFVAAAVATNRIRAEWILFALTTSTALIALMVLTIDFSHVGFLSGSAGTAVHDAATDCTSLGVILGAAAVLHALGRGRARGPEQGLLAVWFWTSFVVYLIASVLCSVAVILRATSETYFAVASGLATIAVAIMIRRFRPGPWGIASIVSVAVVMAIAAVTLSPGKRLADLQLSFAAHAPAPLIAVSQRILTETNWAGTGAGTFAAVVPIYRGADELAAGLVAPNIVAKIAVEMGQPFLWAIILAAIVLVITLLRDAARRGRDSIYSIAGACCVVTISLLAFGNPAVFSTPVLVIAAAAIGIAIAQRKSRSI